MSAKTKKTLNTELTNLRRNMTNRRKAMKDKGCKDKCQKKKKAEIAHGKAKVKAVEAELELKDAETKKNRIDNDIKYQEKRIKGLKAKLNKPACTKGNTTCERSRMQAEATKKVADEALEKLKKDKPKADKRYEKKEKDFKQKKAEASSLYSKIPKKIEPDLKF